MGKLVRWADLICPTCQHDILVNGWRDEVYGAFSRGDESAITCQGCQEQITRTVSDAGDSVAPVTYPQLNAREIREKVAWHEASHAAVGVAFGFDLVHAEVPQTPRDGFNGQVVWNFGDNPRLDHTAAATMAGLASDRDWLDRRGLLDRATALDIAHHASWDTQLLTQLAGGDEEAFTRAFRVGQDLARAWLLDHREEVAAVAVELDQRGSLDAEAVRAAMAAGRRRHTIALQAALATTPAPEPLLADLDLPEPRVAEQSQPPVPARAPEPHTTNTEGNVMSIEQLRAGLQEALQRNEQAIGQLAHLGTELEGTAGLLAHIGQGAADVSLTDALGQQAGLVGEIEQITGRINMINAAINEYGSRL